MKTGVSGWWYLRGLFRSRRHLKSLSWGERDLLRRRLRMAPAVLCVMCLMILAGCESFDPELPTATAPREFSAPTLAPSPTAPLILPSPLPADAVQPGQSPPEIGDLPAEGEVPPFIIDRPASITGPQTVSVAVRQGVTVVGQLYENPPVELEQGVITPRLPGVLFIGAPIEAWGAFPAQLRDAGFTVLVVELVSGATDDMRTILRGFSETPSVNPGLIAVIGAELGADLALVGCAAEGLCDALVLLSPLTASTLLNVIGDYNPRPLLVVAGTEDLEASDTAQALQAVATGPYTLQPYPGADRGVRLLINQPPLATVISDWLQANLSDFSGQ